MIAKKNFLKQTVSEELIQNLGFELCSQQIRKVRAYLNLGTILKALPSKVEIHNRVPFLAHTPPPTLNNVQDFNLRLGIHTNRK